MALPDDGACGVAADGAGFVAVGCGFTGAGAVGCCVIGREGTGADGALAVGAGAGAGAGLSLREVPCWLTG